jgi:cysteine-rich repeat protein
MFPQSSVSREVVMRKLALLVACGCLALPAHAAFHLMKVVEVFPGTAASPTAQYVVLQMYAQNQHMVSGHSVRVYNAQGTVVGTFMFPGNMANGANQAKIFVGTSAAATLAGFTTDLTMTAVIAPAGGKVCFDTIDCVSWGTYTGIDVGTPFAQGTGLLLGQAARRDLGADGILQAADDTDDSAADFAFARPAPRKNSGVGCGDGAPQPLEQCDDGNVSNNDACLSSCASATCGDGFLWNVTEDCDDGNGSNEDACLTTCVTAGCGDGFTWSGIEECDDGNGSNEDACLTGCIDATCGDGFTWSGVEECDDGNDTGGDGCSATCTFEGVLEAAALTAGRGAGSTVTFEFAPACGAADHAVYWGVSPIGGALVWSGAACGLGTTGSSVFDPGTPAAGSFQYFVVVGYTATAEGSYGVNSLAAQRPEATGVGACDRARVLGVTCP